MHEMSAEFLTELEAVQSVHPNLTVVILSEEHMIEAKHHAGGKRLSSSKNNENEPNIDGNEDSSSADTQFYHATIQLTCSPQKNLASFVSTDIQISVPTLYPVTRPVFEILRCSGIYDEGRKIKELVDCLIKDSPPEEYLLFQIISTVHDFLDSCKIGECAICSEEIAEFVCEG